MPITPLAEPLRVLLLTVACTAGIFDIYTRRIPNWLCAFGLAVGISANYCLTGAGGAVLAAKGLSLAFAIYFPFWLLRGMGAGDVKLMAALGAIAGPAHWIVLFITASLLGSVAAFALACRAGRGVDVLLNTVTLARELALFRPPWRALPETDFRDANALRVPHGAIIGAAAILLTICSVMGLVRF